MDRVSGHLSKMRIEAGEKARYLMRLDDVEVPLDPYFGRRVSLTLPGSIQCQECGKSIKKTYAEGHCYPCTMRLASCDMCIVRPEKCHYDQGTCREPAWGEAHCMKPHIVYLANTAGLKVGITRAVNVPTRWLDQGATQAIPILRVSTRLQSGIFEVMLKKHISDKTNWREMLKGVDRVLDMEEHRDILFESAADGMDDLCSRFDDEIEVLEEAEPVTLDYPVLAYPTKIRSLNPEKKPRIEGVLKGAKGQYLIFDCGVINIRKHAGYEATLSLED